MSRKRLNQFVFGGMAIAAELCAGGMPDLGRALELPDDSDVGWMYKPPPLMYCGAVYGAGEGLTKPA
jgi:hypothetical protein